MRKPLLILLFIAGSTISFAQQSGRMETDRPDQTESPFITKKNWLQTEIGLTIAKDIGLSSILHPTILWKYGVSKRFELRLLTEFVSHENPVIIPDGNDFITGLNPIQIGGKIALWEEKGLLPQTTIIFHTSIPKAASKNLKLNKWAPEFILSMQNSLSEKIGLGYNLGAAWDGISKTPYWLYTLSTGFNLGKNGYTYIEIFGAVRKYEMPQHSADCGFGYYINDNFKIDISGGLGITENAADWFTAAGFSFRFNTGKKK